jgi:HD-GYP domain-containing protein (c-di-GMP phosphodiesterase class II)
VIAACDAYDAITSDRCYRERIDHEGACEELRREAGHQFDANVVQALLEELRASDGLPRTSSAVPETPSRVADEVAAYLREVLARHAADRIGLEAQ